MRLALVAALALGGCVGAGATVVTVRSDGTIVSAEQRTVGVGLCAPGACGRR